MTKSPSNVWIASWVMIKKHIPICRYILVQGITFCESKLRFKIDEKYYNVHFCYKSINMEDDINYDKINESFRRCARCEKFLAIKFFHPKKNAKGKTNIKILRTCSFCREKDSIHRISRKCRHGTRKDFCKQCKGRSICEHNRIRSDCTSCVGGSICEHNRRRRNCLECVGSGICQHNRRRSCCKACGGISICEHNHVRNSCGKCTHICEHNSMKYKCKTCKKLEEQEELEEPEELEESKCKHNEIAIECVDCFLDD